MAEPETTETPTVTVPLRRDAGGAWRVAGTRVPLDTVVAAFDAGATPEEICQRFPTLALADVYAVLGYYMQHRPEVEAYLRRREQEAADARREVEARHDPRGLRERLLGRAGTPEDVAGRVHFLPLR
jgi:uncharacterized protein (DUF433 family)